MGDSSTSLENPNPKIEIRDHVILENDQTLSMPLAQGSTSSSTMKSSSSSFISTLSNFPRDLGDGDACGGCNIGICVEPSAAATTNDDDDLTTTSTTTTTNLGKKPSCDCRNTGYVGEHCQIPCAKQCRNGGKCVPPTNTDATTQEETCACAKAVVDGNPYAGIRCEYGATQSCMTLGSESKHSFCTNGGQCAEIVGDNEAHVPCDCPEGYVGDKCEYLIGRVPSWYSNSTSSAASSSSSSSAASMEQQQQQQQQQSENQSVIFFAVVVAMGSMILIVILVMVVRSYRRKREDRRQEREARRATEDLSMVPMRDRRREGGDDDDVEEEEDGII